MRECAPQSGEKLTLTLCTSLLHNAFDARFRFILGCDSSSVAVSSNASPFATPIDATEWRATIGERCCGKVKERATTLKTSADPVVEADVLCWAAESARSFS
jgi:hypothetical protein